MCGVTTAKKAKKAKKLKKLMWQAPKN